MDNENTTQKKNIANPKTKKLGIGLLIFSVVAWLLIFAVPFLPVEMNTRIFIAAALGIGGEIAFWIGGIILGREAARRYRKQLNPRNWFKNKSE
ncbi:transporter suffix domain-containing protein [Alkalihalobacillus sp. AL-G]|uniref:transporter suffix domain-containing protein n=1 Tax=Alkalihalobacillus sp. AL-G TaxID=2926399 RepID=UPI002729C421|nr:transporter suffix domain-containing protein [Alkalihalobacillus sp. AL-G]WLD94367.1 transporter suffix domain-containing protein [Alkalihalobacillus sp. AL-G]